MFASKTTRSFYDASINTSMPDDVVEISAENHADLLSGQSEGKVIAWGDDGYPILIDPPAKSLEQMQATAWNHIKAERELRTLSGVKVGSIWVHSDVFSRSQWLGLKDGARDALAGGGVMTDALYDNKGQAIIWKMLDNTFVPVTVQITFDVVSAVASSDTAIFTAAERHNAAMLASKDPESYDYSTAWPQTFVEWSATQGV